MISFAEIAASERLSISQMLLNHQNYWAHTRTRNGVDEQETLHEHISLVLNYTLRICREHGIERIVDNLCVTLAERLAPFHKVEFIHFTKTLFLTAIAYHDTGKVNENFQRKIGNPIFKNKSIDNSIKSDHSILSVVVFLAEADRMLKGIQWVEENKAEKGVFIWVFLSLAETIKQHHQSLRNSSGELFGFTQKSPPDIAKLSQYLTRFKELSNHIDPVQAIVTSEKKYKERFYKNFGEQFELFALTKLCFSVLTAADYLATNEYMISLSVIDIGIMTHELKERIYRGVNTKHEEFRIANHISPNSLNTLRLSIADEARATISENISRNLFYLEAPTGSGKTHTSLLLAAELLSKRSDLNKLYYVFPFTTLATQTFNAINSTLNLVEGELAEIHSKAPFYSKKVEQENKIEKQIIEYEEKDAEYGRERRSFLDALFVNFPISLMTHVRFFGGLLSNEKEKNYLLHRLSNSVVIIDEIQSYPLQQWNAIAYTLQQFSQAFNIVFIVMSATLPKIGNLIRSKEWNTDSFASLIADKQRYFSDKVFAERVMFDDSFLKDGVITPKELCPFVVKAITEYTDSKSSVNECIGIRVMAEFLTKKSARQFYDIAKECSDFQDFNVMLLSGTILEPRRREIINTIKKSTANDKILLVCTQVVEAGVDIDMDMGFKDISIIDSEEQCAGRINRNATKTGTILYLFRTGDASTVYRNDARSTYNLLKSSAMDILSTKNFDVAYNPVFETIEKNNTNEMMATHYKDFRKGILRLDYSIVKDCTEIIKNQSYSVFVPLCISIQHFTPLEQNLLTDCIKDENVSGTLVWELYEQTVTGKDRVGESFIDRAAKLKRLSSVMSKFTFSLNDSQFKSLRSYTDRGSADGNYLHYGYFYFAHYQTENMYSYENGLQLNSDSMSNFI